MKKKFNWKSVIRHATGWLIRFLETSGATIYIILLFCAIRKELPSLGWAILCGFVGGTIAFAVSEAHDWAKK